jgi:hypothetical protein
VLADKNALAMRYFREAKAQALCALQGLENYVNDNLDVVLFSGEGDSLHQMFDCMVQGPYARMDLWSRGSNNKLAVPNWARDADGIGLSRTLDLPCSNAKLEGDMKAPFTCGGSTRRAVIKYFVRDHINKNSDGSSLVVALIRKQIARLKAAWEQDVSLFACQHVNGTHGLEYCDAGNADGFSPPVLQVPFDAIASSDILKDIVGEIWPYLQEALAGGNRNREFFQYHGDPVEQQSWNWVASGTANLAKDDGLYDSQLPVVNYSTGETGYAFARNTSIWDMCVGMVSQVMFTMPMASIVIDGHESWTAASVLGLRTDILQFDPTLEPDFDGEDPNGKHLV